MFFIGVLAGGVIPRAFLPFVASPPRWRETCRQAGAPFTDVVIVGSDAFISQQTGKIYRNCQPWMNLSVWSEGEAGLLAMATDGQQLFASFTAPDRTITVAAINVTTKELHVLATFGQSNDEHSAAALMFIDRFLIVGIGDNHIEASAQDPRLPNGKLWILDLQTNELRLLAKGLRNPWQMAQLDDGIYFVDVGNQSREEVNRLPNLEGNYNFGWPCWEGTKQNLFDLTVCDSDLQPPIFEYNHSVGQAIVGVTMIGGQKTYADFSGVVRTWQGEEVRRVDGRISKLTMISRGAAILSFAAGLAICDLLK